MVRLEQLKIDAMDMIISIQGVPWSIGSWYTCGWLYRHIRGHLTRLLRTWVSYTSRSNNVEQRCPRSVLWMLDLIKYVL